MTYNPFDIILLLILLWALYRGFRNGLVVELCGILGIVIGGWVAYKFSSLFLSWTSLNFPYCEEIAFVVTLVGVIVLLAFVARIVSKLLSTVGLGVINSLLGAVASTIKLVLVVSLLLAAFDAINNRSGFVSAGSIAKSKGYGVILGVSTLVFPYINFVTDYYDTIKKNITEEDGEV